MENKYIILEYNDHFNVEVETEKVTTEPWFWILEKPKTIRYWHKISKRGELMHIRNCFLEDFEFKTLEEAKQFIKDWEKYPIIHEYTDSKEPPLRDTNTYFENGNKVNNDV